jgi:4-alpha-glucanotransferase
MADADELIRKAEALGVETSYLDAHGERRSPGRDSLRGIVEVVSRRAEGAAASVLVARLGHLPHFDHMCSPGTDWRLLAGDHVVASGACDSSSLRLPEGLPVGSYRLVTDAPAPAPHLVMVAPQQAYQPDIFRDGRRLWAIAVQLYGLRSRRNWGIGDFTDLAELIRLAASLGAAGIALNPLHALFPDSPDHESPYSPSSRLFLNPLYIDAESIAEFPGHRVAGVAEEELARLRAGDMVDYAGVTTLKLKALRAAYAAFQASASGARRDDFAAFKEERGSLLERFAAFETLRRALRSPWWEWPLKWQRPSAEALGELRRIAGVEMEFSAFLQWEADRQLGACQRLARELGLPVGLYLDVAVGVEADSADVWSDPDALLRDLAAGAPPDIYNVAGQNWGLASFHPGVLAATDFQPFRETLRAVMRHAGAIRLDHVLGLNRLFLIPRGSRPSEGTYVRFPLEAMLAVVAQESHAARCLVIGEDLGTVPEGLRETLADWNVWTYRVMLFERAADGSFRPPEDYPAAALATFTTHDLPTFAGWLAGHDLALKRRLGIDLGESEEERAAARRALQDALARTCGASRLGFPEVVRYLARTPSRLLVVAAEDIFGVLDQTNLPATVSEHPNWRRRLPVDLEAFASDARLAEIAEVLAAEGRASAPR